MTALHTAAREAGLVWSYRDGAGRWQEASDASIEAVLAALGSEPPAATSRAILAGRPFDPGPGPWVLETEAGEVDHGTGPLPPLPIGYHLLRQGARRMHLLAAPARLPAPPRAWGVTAPLYGLWEGEPAGLGTYRLLGDLAEGLAPSGAAFLGVNPIHAGFPLDPGNFSPYAPSHRGRLNVLHIDAGASGGAGPLIDYPAAIAAQRAALEAGYAAFPGDPGFDAWREAEGVEGFARHQALSEVHGPYWNRWPLPFQSPDSLEVQEFAARSSDRIRFHAWAQWQASRQLSDSQSRARKAGMRLGLYTDLAVGTHPFGAETWADPGLFAHGVSLGAPPDLLGPSGQRWGLAPMRPNALMSSGFKALRAILRAQLRHAGMLRIDHILGFERGFWLPEGLPGLYVAMPRAELLAVVRIEAARAGAVVVGEDLGTIPEGLRAALDQAGVLGCRVAMFERDWDGDGAFTAPETYTEAALASWGSHDLPTWAGWRKGRDLDWRETLGELADPAAARARRAAEVAGFDALAGPAPADLARHLAASASRLVAVQAEDLLGAEEQANLPGTVLEHPNWRRRLALPASALAGTLAETAAIMAAAGRNSQETA